MNEVTFNKLVLFISIFVLVSFGKQMAALAALRARNLGTPSQHKHRRPRTGVRPPPPPSSTTQRREGSSLAL
jgi:hypothetical protein